LAFKDATGNDSQLTYVELATITRIWCIYGGVLQVPSTYHINITQIWKCEKSINKKGNIFDTNMSTARRGCNKAWGVRATN